eukprot:6188579-Pleurochrysis_carterae.AAC.1
MSDKFREISAMTYVLPRLVAPVERGTTHQVHRFLNSQMCDALPATTLNIMLYMYLFYQSFLELLVAIDAAQRIVTCMEREPARASTVACARASQVAMTATARLRVSDAVSTAVSAFGVEEYARSRGAEQISRLGMRGGLRGNGTASASLSLRIRPSPRFSCARL